jgi:serine/threonine protein kinase
MEEKNEKDKQESGPFDETLAQGPTVPDSSPGGGSSSHLPVPREVLTFLKDPSRKLHQYILVEEIGRGGMGAVWKAWDSKLARWAAIKFLSLSDEMSIRRFDREAQLSAQLRHPNIAAIHEVNEEGTRHFLVMDYIDGSTIGKAKLSWKDLLKAFVKILRAVDFAHGRSIIHRDIKPENILIGKDGEPYVTDFGLAKVLRTDSSLSRTGAIMGTPVFMSPEQAEGRTSQVDSRSDIYSLGATLYTLVTGHLPFEGDDMTTILEKVSLEDPTPASKVNPDIEKELEAIIMKAMAKAKMDRYSSAGEFADDLQRYRERGEVRARKPRRWKTWIRRMRHRGNWTAAATLLAIIGAGGAVLWFSRENPPAPPPEKPDEGRAWRDRFHPRQRELAFYGFEPVSAEFTRQTNQVLSEMPSPEQKSVSDWFEAQLDRFPAEPWPKSEWRANQEEAKRIENWCATVDLVLDGVPGKFGEIREELARRQALFAAVAEYRGSISLRLLIWPYAELRSFRVGEKWIVKEGRSLDPGVVIPGGSLSTPLEIRGLDIGDYIIELAHPELGTREVKITSDGVKHGETYACSGALSDPDSIRLRRLP